MTTQSERGHESKFVHSVLPWLVAAGALVVYLITLNSWVSFDNLAQTAKSSGWLWGMELFNPLYFVVTYHTRWLPVTQVPLALNIFSAICSALTLALLARSVALLPHDRTEAQRRREHSRSGLLSRRGSWIPPVLAAMVCGLQLTFWEDATNGSKDTFEILLLAYAIRCLLEFRVQGRNSWMYRAILVWGAGIANGWLMIALTPFFLISIVWIKGLSFFDIRFLLKSTFFGLTGLLVFLLLPLLYVFSQDAVGGFGEAFWRALKTSLSSDKAIISSLISGMPTNVVLLLAMTSLLPILVVGIRWASNFGDPSRVGSWIAAWIFHLAHGALLGVCVWTAFDPMFSPRQMGRAIPLLSNYFTSLVPALYYLGALGVGYLSGYFLIVFDPVPDHMGRTAKWQAWLHRASRAGVVLLVALIPIGLIFRNTPQIQMTNGPALRDYASLLVRNLPDGAVLLCDTDDSVHNIPRKLLLAQAWLARSRPTTNYYFLDTALLRMPAYHAYQLRQHPNKWPALVNIKSFEVVDEIVLINLMIGLSEQASVNYLHPSFGYYFEHFFQQPHGLSLSLTRYPTNSLSEPPLTEKDIADNEKIWAEHREALERLKPFIAPPAVSTNEGFRQKLMTRLYLPFEPNFTAVTLGSFYSRALNHWGVQLQRAGRLKEAERHFQTAIELNTRNIAAKGNLDLNRILQSSLRPPFRIPRSFEEELVGYRSLQQVLRETGPFDDPTQCFGQAVIFAADKFFRQSAQQSERVHELVPDNPIVSVWLARLYIVNGFPQKALDLVAELQPHLEKGAEIDIGEGDLLQVEVSALWAADRRDEAEQRLRKAIDKNPIDENTLARIVQISTSLKLYTNALLAIDRQLKLRADDGDALMSKGVYNMQLGHFQEAIPPFTHALKIHTNNHNVRLYRAVAFLNCDRLDEAQRDFECLQKEFPKSIDVLGGLAEVALKKTDTNTAIRYYELCLANVTPGSDQAKAINDRLQTLKAGPKP